MAGWLLGTGNFTWNAIERRSDRYGSVKLTDEFQDSNILLHSDMDRLEGKHGRLFAEVLRPVVSSHIGDTARGLKPSTPNKGEIVILGEGTLFIEHRGIAIHEKSEMEFQDEAMFKSMEAMFAGAGNQVSLSKSGNAGSPDLEEEVYDLIGLKPDDGRETDWLDPKAFYRLHLSLINLWFEETPGEGQ